MKVKELIGKLRELDGEREIYYWDWEYWFTEIEEVRDEAKVKYTFSGYNELWNPVLEWGLNDYNRAKKDGYRIISKNDIYCIY